MIRKLFWRWLRSHTYGQGLHVGTTFPMWDMLRAYQAGFKAGQKARKR